MNTRSLIATGMVCATVVAVAGFLSNAGPLSPPAGPIAPTNKTLDEVEPRIAVNAANTPGDATSLFVISQPGSYYLTGNITGATGKNGIEITASNVTLDLNGFALQGVAGSLDGVRVSVAVTSVAVVNGSVAGWGGNGVNLGAATKSALRFVRAVNNGSLGVRVGNDSVVDSCFAGANGAIGLVAGSSCSIANSVAAENSGHGISASTGAVVVACTARNNASTGISASSGAHVSKCTASSNSGDGFFISAGVIIGCTASTNGDDGIVAGSGATIINNSTSMNAGDGIEANADSLVRGNTCDSNGLGAGDGAGIHIVGSDTCVEKNNVTDNDRGIDVDVCGNLIIRNSATGNTTSYDIALNNRYGPIVKISAVGSPAVIGSAALGTLQTNDPWTNFSF